MASDDWAYAVSGAWEDAGNWENGVPGAGDSAYITAPGNYTVTMSTAQSFSDLLVLGATFVENSTASMTSAGAFDVYDCSAFLNADNAGLTGGLAMDHSTVTIGHTDALGTITVQMNNGAALRSSVNTTVANAITFGEGGAGDLDGLTISAAARTTLALTGALTFNYVATFGSATDVGTVLLAPSAVTSNVGATSITVADGTLQLGNDLAATLITSVGFGFPLTAAGATLDLNGFSVTIDALSNVGTITNSSGSLATLTLASSTTGGGTIGGDIDLALNASNPVTYDGSLALTEFGGITLTNSDNTDPTDSSAYDTLPFPAPCRSDGAANCRSTPAPP